MLYDFSAIGLEFQEQKFLQEFPVEICTFCAPGPRPKSSTMHDCTPDVPFGEFIAPNSEAFSKGFYWRFLVYMYVRFLAATALGDILCICTRFATAPLHAVDTELH